MTSVRGKGRQGGPVTGFNPRLMDVFAVLADASAGAPPAPRAAADLSWHDLAECQYVDPELWFPERGGSSREAKRICRSCPVRARCLEYALAHDDIGRFGIWGGLSEVERRPLRSARQQAAGEAA